MSVATDLITRLEQAKLAGYRTGPANPRYAGYQFRSNEAAAHTAAIEILQWLRDLGNQRLSLVIAQLEEELLKSANYGEL